MMRLGSVVRDLALVCLAVAVGWWWRGAGTTVLASSIEFVCRQRRTWRFSSSGAGRSSRSRSINPENHTLYMYPRVAEGNSHISCEYSFTVNKPGAAMDRQNCPVGEDAAAVGTRPDSRQNSPGSAVFLRDMERRKVGILGATGMVGQRFIQLLHNHPWFEVAWLAASDRSAGKTYGEACKWKLDTPLPAHIAAMTVMPNVPEGTPEGELPKIIFAALDADVARELEPKFAAAGCAVVSNSSAFRMAADVPLVVPEVNADHLALIERQSWRRGERRIYRHQSQLLRHRAGAGAEAAGRAVRD